MKKVLSVAMASAMVLGMGANAFAISYSTGSNEKAQSAARQLFSGVADHENMPTTQLDAALVKDGKVGLLAAMVGAKLCGSNREARQLVQQGGVLVDGEKVTDPTFGLTVEQLQNGVVIKKGKKTYHKVMLCLSEFIK